MEFFLYAFYNEDDKRIREVQTMKVIGFLLKVAVKILVFPVMFLMIFAYWIVGMLVNISGYVLSPVALFVLACGIYSVIKAS